MRAGSEGRFYWVPGHGGVEGNEIADSIAKSTLMKGEIYVHIQSQVKKISSRSGVQRD